jgi:hypothetical protein
VLFRYAEEGEDSAAEIVRQYAMKAYESAGVWIDGDGSLCLVVFAEFEEGGDEMLLLYASELRDRPQDISKASEWALLDAGDGTHLQQDCDGIIDVDLPTRPPED